jgi:alkanesulfonate monooxygenase SsuD/methylene tetrahydromethanopterin reductase-like flavin-dependent oxidoreductase (luciferase family)
MESHELMKDLLRKTSAKQVCAELNLSLSLIYKWAEAPVANAGSGAVNPLDRVEKLLQCTGDQRIAEWVAQRAGGYFVNNPAPANSTDALIPSTNAIVQQFADMLGIIATAAADQNITADEAKKIRAQWERLKSITEGFVQSAEAGNFGELQSSLEKLDGKKSS